MATAKVFWSGRSQAVRLPKEFRVEGDEVRIRREGSRIILEPLQDDWAWLEALVRDSAGLFDEEFIQAVEEELPMQERPELDNLP
jgi:antitoxin VapB